MAYTWYALIGATITFVAGCAGGVLARQAATVMASSDDGDGRCTVDTHSQVADMSAVRVFVPSAIALACC